VSELSEAVEQAALHLENEHSRVAFKAKNLREREKPVLAAQEQKTADALRTLLDSWRQQKRLIDEWNQPVPQSDWERLKAELAEAHACIESHDPLRGKVVDLEKRARTAEAELAAAREAITFMRDEYSPVGGRGCALCLYENGRFIRSCKLHQVLAAANERAEKAIALVWDVATGRLFNRDKIWQRAQALAPAPPTDEPK
jgi:hypothetical protein